MHVPGIVPKLEAVKESDRLLSGLIDLQHLSIGFNHLTPLLVMVHIKQSGLLTV